MTDVGVLGAGVIGAGVAQAAAEAGFSVAAVDLTAEALTRARNAVTAGLRTKRLLGRLAAGDDLDEVAGRIAFGTDPSAFSSCSVVVENISEDLDAKLSAHSRLAEICSADALVCCNTSVIPIARLAAQWDQPSRVVGMHFMNPVPLTPGVEIIRTTDSTPDAIERARAFASALGKESVIVGDSPGFVSNRILMAMVNDAFELLREGVASAEEIDRLFRLCFGHRMGPFETADLIGLDTVQLSLRELLRFTDDARFIPSPRLTELVADGALGRKTGRGVYVY